MRLLRRKMLNPLITNKILLKSQDAETCMRLLATTAPPADSPGGIEGGT